MNIKEKKEKNEFLEIGKIVSTQGLKGEVRVEPWCDSPEFMLEFDTLYLDTSHTKIEVESGRAQKNVVILKLCGFSTVEQANTLRGKLLYIKREDVTLPKGSYFVQDLIGLRVINADDPLIVYGTLTQVSATGANDVYHIEKEGKEWLIPAIPLVVFETLINEGIMKITPIEGLFDDED